jgi:hypothetical protein
MYILASYLQCTSFGNDLIDCVSRSMPGTQISFLPPCDVINSIHQSTVGDCGFRRLLVAWSVWSPVHAEWKGEYWWRTYLSGLPAEYYHDLALSLLRKNHQLDQNPFADGKTSQRFHDAVLGFRAVRPAFKNDEPACTPAA